MGVEQETQESLCAGPQCAVHRRQSSFSVVGTMFIRGIRRWLCLTIMYVKSRNSIKFQVIRKYRSLFTQATARSETEMFRKESFE